MTVKTFDSFEEMQEELRRSREAADAQIRSWQRDVQPGTKIIRVAPAFGKPVVIYGEIVDPVELDRPHYDMDDPEERCMFEGVKARYTGSWVQSFRFGRFYSPLCSEGELGDIHLATITAVITPEEFEDARARDWPQDFGFAAMANVRSTEGEKP